MTDRFESGRWLVEAVKDFNIKSPDNLLKFNKFDYNVEVESQYELGKKYYVLFGQNTCCCNCPDFEKGLKKNKETEMYSCKHIVATYYYYKKYKNLKESFKYIDECAENGFNTYII